VSRSEVGDHDQCLSGHAPLRRIAFTQVTFMPGRVSGFSQYCSTVRQMLVSPDLTTFCPPQAGYGDSTSIRFLPESFCGLHFLFSRIDSGCQGRRSARFALMFLMKNTQGSNSRQLDPLQSSWKHAEASRLTRHRGCATAIVRCNTKCGGD